MYALNTLATNHDPKIIALLVLVGIWSIAWKGFALWRAARLKQPYWFIALLVINTVGLLEIIYLFVITRKKKRAPRIKQETLA